MLRYKTKTRPGLVALYDIRTGNGAGPFLQPRSPHGATRLGHHFQGQNVKGQGHQAALLTAALTRQAAAAVTVATYWPWEPTATLRSALCRRGRLGGAVRGVYRGRRGAGHIVAAAHLQFVNECCVSPLPWRNLAPVS